MQIETTIVIKKEILQKLTDAAVITGKSRSSIISALLQKYAEGNTSSPKTWSRIRYQDRGEKEHWRQLHLMLNPDEYEFVLDLRKVFKRSVSACVADAIVEYLNEILCIIKNNTDNYRYHNYSFTRIVIDDIICWILSWGVPQKPLTQLHL